MVPQSIKTDTAWLSVQDSVLDVGQAFAFLQTEGAGGINLFVGTTRRWTGDLETASLEYECYAEMALQEMERLIGKAKTQWPVQKACLWHRVGNVPVSEASIVIGVATAHRVASFDATRYLIDTAKQQLPVWKKEIFTDGQTLWVQGSKPDVNAPGNS